MPHKPHASLRLSLLIILFAIVQPSFYPQAKSSTDSNSERKATKLKTDKPIEQAIHNGEEFAYEIKLKAGEYLNALIEQQGIDLAIRLIAPDGRQLAEIPPATPMQKSKSITCIAVTTGEYRLLVAAPPDLAQSGSYTLRIAERREATAKELALQQADELSKEADRLYNEGKFDQAAPLLERVLTIREIELGSENTDVATTLNDLALIYQQQGNYVKAEPLYVRSFAIREKLLGENNPAFNESLINLGTLYFSKGDYVKAEPLMRRALQSAEKIYGAEHPNIASYLNNLGSLYQERGDYLKSESLYQRALTIREKAFGAEHPLVARSLNNLANLYYTMGEYAKAEPLYRRALTIGEKLLGADHPSIAATINNLAVLYYTQGNYALAEPLYLRSLAIREKMMGAEHPAVATILNNLAEIYSAQGNFAKAEPLYQRALAIREKAFGGDHPAVAEILSNLASFYQTKGDTAQMIAYQSRSMSIKEKNIVLNLSLGSERQKLLYLATFENEENTTIAMHLQSAPNDATARRLALTTILRRKGRALDAMSDSIGALRRRLNAQDRLLLDDLNKTRTRLATLVGGSAGGNDANVRDAEIKQLKERIEKLEADISARSAEFRAQSKSVSIDDVQATIPANAALIEFVWFRAYDAGTKMYDDPRYAAYVLRNQGEPLSVELGKAKAIDEKLAEFRQSLRDRKNPDVMKIARQVDQLVMQPVRELLEVRQEEERKYGRAEKEKRTTGEQVKAARGNRQSRRGNLRAASAPLPLFSSSPLHLFLSPDASLNLIPFAALVDERGHYLVERFSFTYLTSGRDLLRLQVKNTNANAPLILADPDFGKATEGTATQSGGGEFGDILFEQLKGTAEEAKELQTLFPNATVLTREQATEAALKAAVHPSILHIATHGFFLDANTEVQTEDSGGKKRLAIRRHPKTEKTSTQPPGFYTPLLLSGLGLAGANEHISTGGNDGILTALEAAGLDLWGTKLVVLSACDTGIGKVINGDGIYGLRRALVLAGSESQMLSLWRVSDSGTRELMFDYYKRLKAGAGRGEALRQAQLKLLANPTRKHPFYWAAFIQSGEWATLDGKR